MKEIIRVENLSKAYRIGLKQQSHDTLFGKVADMVKAPLRNLKNLRSLTRFDGAEDPTVHWALKDIDFTVNEGEVLGIIGHNGAGKSTLLKILSRVTEPTTGRITIHGRVGALLEVGTGFHPELTGRENIYMNGTILGMTKKEIDRKLDEIVDFSGVEKYIDTPVKFYSSGMKVRLGFAVAAHLDPEILIIDEVLAVGDVEFQRKCLGKMEDVSRSGRTVLFVSHNMTAISNLCKRCIVLKQGTISKIDDASDAVKHYVHNSIKTSEVQQIRFVWDLKSAPGDERIKLLKFSVTPANSEKIFYKDCAICFNICFNILDDRVKVVGFNIYLSTMEGVLVCHIGRQLLKEEMNGVGLYQTSLIFPPNVLNVGWYSANLMIGLNTTEPLIHTGDIKFNIIGNKNASIIKELKGIIQPKVKFSVKKLKNTAFEHEEGK
ncbi:MAG: hypothetical protein CMN32_12885 [Saprospirales bacterium]|nr:hypothetical protein [Saprospirales bacterium]